MRAEKSCYKPMNRFGASWKRAGARTLSVLSLVIMPVSMMGETAP